MSVPERPSTVSVLSQSEHPADEQVFRADDGTLLVEGDHFFEQPPGREVVLTDVVQRVGDGVVMPNGTRGEVRVRLELQWTKSQRPPSQVRVGDARQPTHHELSLDEFLAELDADDGRFAAYAANGLPRVP